MVEDLTTVVFPSAGYASLPLCAPEELICCVAAGPGGHPLRVLIDTGTDPSAVDAGLARRLALRTGGSGIGLGAASNAVPFTEAVLPWLRLGDLTIRDLFAPALDLRPFGVDVVLGYNVLHQAAMRVDYTRRQLTLAHPDLGLPAEPSSITFPMVFFEHFPALRDVEVGGVRVEYATIDTGSNAALTVGPDVAAALGVTPEVVGVRHGRGAGFGGGGAVLRGCYHAVRVGPLTLGDVEVDTPAAPVGDLARSGRANIGNRLLARFAAFSLDYERRLVCFEPYE
jgi:hypothetical protein